MSMSQFRQGKDSPPNELSAKEESEAPEISPDIFEKLKEKKKKGLWSGEIEHIEIKEHNLTAGKHFYIMEDVRKRSIMCTSCPVKHGGILEAKLLTRYTLEDGVLFLDGKPTHEKP